MSPMQSVSGPKKSKPLPQFVREGDMERLLSATAQGESWQESRVHVILQLFYNYIISKIDNLVNAMEDASITLVDILTAYNKK